MNIDGLSFLISVSCTAILFIAWFIYRFFKNAKQLKELNNILGDIKSRNAKIVHRVKEEELRLMQEKEKLLMHTQVSAEGICFFKSDHTVDFYNGLFLQYFNMITYDSLNIEHDVLSDKVFAPVVNFLNTRTSEDNFETRINRQGNEFSLLVNAFADKSFEIILIDITAREKIRRLKYEMTENIAHELRTPVTSIHGFLETLLNNNLAEQKKNEFLQRAFAQTQLLSELISDMSLLTKIDNKAPSLKLKNVFVSQVIAHVCADASILLQEKNIKFNNEVPDTIEVAGNSNLLYSIFRNLTDNVLRYAGNNVEINIKIQEIKEGKAYFIFADNGKGIEDEIHLGRLFDRFYRVEKGRTRDTGGSGLGLSIVKNAVFFHGGTISVRKGKKSGLEFLFSLTLAKH